MRSRVIAAIAIVLLPTLLAAHELDLKLPSLASLKARATQTFHLRLGRWALHTASFFLRDDNDPEVSQVRQVLKQLTSVKIQTYEFDSAFECPRAQADAGWSPLVQVRNRRTNDDVDIYVSTQDRDIRGTVIISCEQRELTIVNIDGKVDAEALANLQRTLKPIRHNPEVGLL